MLLKTKSSSVTTFDAPSTSFPLESKKASFISSAMSKLFAFTVAFTVVSAVTSLTEIAETVFPFSS